MAGFLAGTGIQLETMSLNSIVGGFSFASALAWMDVVRWIISKVVKTSGGGGAYYLMSAVFTTLLAIIVFFVISKVAANVKIEKSQQVYAIGR
jgi:di/tricarboxylate transporter